MSLDPTSRFAPHTVLLIAIELFHLVTVIIVGSSMLRCFLKVYGQALNVL